MRHSIPAISLFLTLLVVSSGSAQVARVASDQSRGKFYDGISKGLVNSLNSWQQQYPNQTPQANQSPQIQTARRSIQSIADEAGQLITALRYEERYSQHARGLLGEALRVKAMADVLLTRSSSVATIEQLSSEYAAIDQQWHLLSHQIQQTQNLSNTVMERVRRMDQINTDLEKQFNLQPQMDTGGLIYYFSALSEDLNNLAEDIRIDLFAHEKRQELTSSVLRLQTKSQRLRLATENNYRYDDVAEYYKSFHTEWLATKNQLRNIQNRYIHRGINRIAQLNNQIHELLFLPPVIDGRDILYQADMLRSQVDATANEISLKELLEQPNANELFIKTREFYTLCSDFRNSVATETQLDNLRWDFRGLEVAWDDVKTSLNPMRRQETIQNISSIESSITQLRYDLGLNAVAETQAIELASSLTNMTGLMFYEVNRIVGRSSQFSSQFRNQAVSQAEQLKKTAEQLGTYLARQQDGPEIAQLSRRLAQQWNDLQSTLGQIPYGQRAELAQTGQQLGPAVAKLQVMYSM